MFKQHISLIRLSKLFSLSNIETNDSFSYGSKNILMNLVLIKV